MNYYPHHIGDYLRDTSHLTLVEHGAYRRMLDLYYASEKPLPLDPVWICRLVRAEHETEREAVKFILEQFFEQKEDGWHSKRADAEIKAAYRRSKAARLNGKKGGRPKTQRVISGLANTNTEITQQKAPKSQKPKANNQNQKEEKKARKRAIPPGFGISNRVRDWASLKGYGQLDRYLEFFVGRMKASGRTYIDWDQAFMNCIGEDWPKFRAASPDYSEVMARIEE